MELIAVTIEQLQPGDKIYNSNGTSLTVSTVLEVNKEGEVIVIGGLDISPNKDNQFIILDQENE